MLPGHNVPGEPGAGRLIDDELTASDGAGLPNEEPRHLPAEGTEARQILGRTLRRRRRVTTTRTGRAGPFRALRGGITRRKDSSFAAVLSDAREGY